jgi:uncharacterized protein YukE
MPGSPYDLYGNVGNLQALAAVQQNYRSRFEGILNDFQSAVARVQGEWVGAGTEGFSTFNLTTSAEYTDVQAAFNRLATATDDAGANWQAAITRINSRWGG